MYMYSFFDAGCIGAYVSVTNQDVLCAILSAVPVCYFSVCCSLRHFTNSNWNFIAMHMLDLV